jgi:hypothetical protein
MCSDGSCLIILIGWQAPTPQNAAATYQEEGQRWDGATPQAIHDR